MADFVKGGDKLKGLRIVIHAGLYFFFLLWRYETIRTQTDSCLRFLYHTQLDITTRTHTHTHAW